MTDLEQEKTAEKDEFALNREISLVHLANAIEGTYQALLHLAVPARRGWISAAQFEVIHSTKEQLRQLHRELTETRERPRQPLEVWVCVGCGELVPKTHAHPCAVGKVRKPRKPRPPEVDRD